MKKMDAVPMKYSASNYVAQANILIRSKQENLSLFEAKLLRLAISQIMKDDNAFKVYTCRVVDLAGFLGMQRENIYMDIEKTVDDLMKRVITIKTTDEKGREVWDKFHWVDHASYKNGMITLMLSSELYPYLLGLRELFTVYDYGDLIRLPTVYSIRLYELLVSYGNYAYTGKKYHHANILDIEGLKNKEVVFTIEYLRRYFNCEDKYPVTHDFIRYIIGASIKAINRVTLQRFAYRTYKEGRRIIAVIFDMNPREEELEKYPRLPEIEDVI